LFSLFVYGVIGKDTVQQKMKVWLKIHPYNLSEPLDWKFHFG